MAVEPEMKALLEQQSKETGLSVSFVIRAAIKQYLSGLQPQVKA